ncbi:MAG: tyrosine--tRNA ligase [Candidatus Omnitrophica bacterium]|nr:tyrosine--tRNA ligase [Candidatus Omnitrophota bacterium]
MNIQETIQYISRGTSEIINLESLTKKLEKSAVTKKPLVIKAGFDPTAPDIHLGHVVLLRKMKQFQDLGHRVLFLIGDFTAQVGDPTGRNELRKKMTREDVERNAVTYKEQVFKVLDPEKTEVVFNSHWFRNFAAQDLMELTARSTVAQMLARADFKKRFEDGREISVLEFIYPLLQGYDSVQIKADVELGGTDQKFNLLMGRQIQEAYGHEPQAVIMTPLLEGLDGVNKMSKSLGNYIGINEPANEIFGKIMSVSDELMIRYYELLTDADLVAVKATHPKEAKLALGAEIVRQFHGISEAKAAREYFENVFSQKHVPDVIEEFVLAQDGSGSLLDILVRSRVVLAKNEGRRLLKQNAITFEGELVTDENWAPKKGVLKVGKRRFLKFV